MTSLRRLGAALAAALAASTVLPAFGEYPDRPIRIITASPGTLMDVVARHVAARLSERWGQPVVVENRGGASFTIGTGMVAHAKPDGYTLVVSDRTALTTAPHLYKDLPYDALRDFTPVTLAAVAPLALVAHPSVPAANMRELVEYARGHAGLHFASQGQYTTGHYAGELLRVEAGIAPEYVHYKGAAESQRAILAGEVLVGFNNAAAMYPLVADGRLKAYAVTSRQRIAAAPNLPTVGEAGYPGVELESWVGVLVPATTSKAVVDKLNQGIVAVLKTAEVRAALLLQGAEVATGTPEEFAARIRADHARVGADFKRIGFGAD